jgi:DNA-binding HxlR family transcriptional regulator
VFADPEQGWALVEALIRDNLDLGRPDRVSLIFDRKVTKRTPGEFYTRVVREGVQPTIRIHYKHSALKQYLKDGRGLRTEMMFNNTQDFGLARDVKHFTRLFELGRQFNQRLLEQEQVSQDCFVPLETLRQLGESTRLENGQRASALRFGDRRTMALLEALACQTYIPQAIGNQTLRALVAPLLGVAPEAYSSAQMTYDLRRLRLKGLIERVAHSHRYRLTSLGLKVVTFFTKLYQRVFRPGLAAMVPHPASLSELAKALEAVVEIIQSWTDRAFSVPVAEVA